MMRMFKAGFGAALAQAVTLLSLPVVTRLYQPDEYALWVITLAAAGIIGLLACLRYELAIMLAKSDSEASQIVWACIGLAVGTALLVAGTIAIEPIGSRLVPVTDAALRWTLPLLVLTPAIGLPIEQWLLRHQMYATVSIAQTARALGTYGTILVWGTVIDGTAMGLVAGTLVGQLAMLGVMAAVLPRWRLQRPRKSLMWSLLKEHRAFPIWSAPYSLVSGLRDRGAVYLLQAYATPTEVAYYGLAFQAMMAPTRLISAGLRPVLFRDAAANGASSIGPDVQRVLGLLAAPSGAAIGLFLLNAETLFGIVFGAQWAGAGYLGSLLIWAGCAGLLTSWVDRIYDVLRLQQWNVIFESGFAVPALGAMWIALVAHWGVGLSVGLYSAIMCAYGFTYLIFIGRRAKWPIRAILIRTAVAAGVSGGAVLALGMLLQAVFPPMLSFGVLVAAVLFFGAVAFLRWRRQT
jgi:O-antigen/teichoic acid export membrane protein